MAAATPARPPRQSRCVCVCVCGGGESRASCPPHSAHRVRGRGGGDRPAPPPPAARGDRGSADPPAAPTPPAAPLLPGSASALAPASARAVAPTSFPAANFCRARALRLRGAGCDSRAPAEPSAGRAPWTPGSRPRPAPRRPQWGLRCRVPIPLPALSGTHIPEPASGAAHQKRRPGCRAPAAPSPGSPGKLGGSPGRRSLALGCSCPQPGVRAPPRQLPRPNSHLSRPPSLGAPGGWSLDTNPRSPCPQLWPLVPPAGRAAPPDTREHRCTYVPRGRRH